MNEDLHMIHPGRIWIDQRLHTDPMVGMQSEGRFYMVRKGFIIVDTD